jgi:hypothetical protein
MPNPTWPNPGLPAASAAKIFADLKKSELADAAVPVEKLYGECSEVVELITAHMAKLQKLIASAHESVRNYRLMRTQLFLRILRRKKLSYCYCPWGTHVAPTTHKTAYADKGGLYLADLCPKHLAEIKESGGYRVEKLRESDGYQIRRNGEWIPLSPDTTIRGGEDEDFLVLDDEGKEYGLPPDIEVITFLMKRTNENWLRQANTGFW